MSGLGFSDIIGDYVRAIDAENAKVKPVAKHPDDPSLCPRCKLRMRTPHAKQYGGFASYCAECLSELNHSYYLKKRKHRV